MAAVSEFIRLTDVDGQAVILNRAAILAIRANQRSDGRESVTFTLTNGGSVEVFAELAEIERQLRPISLSARRGA